MLAQITALQNRVKSAEERAEKFETEKSELETESGELRERADTLSGELEKVTFLMITKMTMLISGES